MSITTVLLCFCALFGHLHASAIPMWEYLSKPEKMSYLYSLFANQVEIYCETSNFPNCNHDLLKFGLKKLKTLPEEYLDSMDPYQRDSNKMIWETMMAGHPLARTTPKPRPTTTAEPNSYEDEPFSDLDFGSASAASAKIDNVYRVTAPKEILEKYNIRPHYTYPHNVVSYLNTFNKPERKAFNKPPETIDITKPPTVKITSEDYFLTGPMVVKVFPDGTPVKEKYPVRYEDEDLRQYKMSQVKIPSL